MASDDRPKLVWLYANTTRTRSMGWLTAKIPALHRDTPRSRMEKLGITRLRHGIS